MLLVLAPLVAEFLLGDFSLTSLPLLLIFIPQYGGGALLIREITRRTGRGWPTIILLALAYALIEEGFTTQSLFNPNYVGQHLLAYGFVPALGTSLNWTIFVLSIHVVWSISTPILIAEGVAGPRRTTPWLGKVGMVVVPVLFVLGCIVTTLGTLQMSSFVASAPQFVAVAVLVVLAVVAAFALFRPGAPRAAASRRPPSPVLVGIGTLVLASAFELIRFDGNGWGLPPAAGVVLMLAFELLAVVLVAWLSRAEGWGPGHYLAIATGTVLTYGWQGMLAFVHGSTHIGAHTGPVDIALQAVLIVAMLGLIAWGVARSRTSESPSPGAGLRGPAQVPPKEVRTQS